MANVTQYDPATNLLHLGGVQIDDYAAGSSVEITTDGDLSAFEKGQRGNGAITKKHSTNAELKITLVKGSTSCKYVGDLFYKWRTGQPLVLPATRFGLTMQFKNTVSGSLATGDNLTPKTEPPMAAADENGSLVFTFIVCNYLPHHSGV